MCGEVKPKDLKKEFSPCGCEITHGVMIMENGDRVPVTCLTYPVELKPNLKEGLK